jgi:hypothetical protein
VDEPIEEFARGVRGKVGKYRANPDQLETRVRQRSRKWMASEIFRAPLNVVRAQIRDMDSSARESGCQKTRNTATPAAEVQDLTRKIRIPDNC